MKISNSKSLIDPSLLRLKILLYSLPGVGKTEWASTAPNPGFASCETGHGKGLLTVADKGIDYAEPETWADMQSIARGELFKEKETLVLDSLSYMCKTIVKNEALKMPRMRGDSPKRRAGVPELDDYGVMGSLTGGFLDTLLKQPKHIVVLATEKYKGGTEEQPELIIGPDLPGALFTDAPAMFDVVLRMRTRPKLRDPKDPKSKYAERYLVTQPDGTSTLQKSRLNRNQKPVLPAEIIFNIETGEGSFGHILSLVQAAYK